MSKRKEQAFVELPRDLRDYVIDEFLAGGTQGAVYGARHKASNMKVVIKLMSSEAAFKVEYEHALMVNHAHSVPLISFCVQAPRYFLVFPRLDKSLLTLVIEWKKASFESKEVSKEHREKEAHALMKQLLPLLKHFGDLKLVHQDLHPDNILIRKGNYFVHDYGWAREIHSIQYGTLTDCLQLLRCARYMIIMDVWRGDFNGDYNANELPQWLLDCIELWRKVPDGALVPYDRMIKIVGEDESKSDAIAQGAKQLYKNRTQLVYYMNQACKVDMNNEETMIITKQVLRPNTWVHMILTEFDGEAWVRITSSKKSTLQSVDFLVKTPEFMLVFLTQFK